MSNPGSLGGAFSFDTPDAVLQVLAAIRASDATPAQKNQLRDLVLSYTNGGKDPSLQIQITQQLTSLGVEPVAVAPTMEISQEPAAGFGSSRSVPTFTTAKSTVQAAPAPTPKPVSAPQPESAEPTPTAEPAVAAPVPPAPAPVAPVPPTPPVAQPPTATPELSPDTPTPALSQPLAANEELDRIREIKGLVNEKVGNPVNLVDIDNEVGREYMSALLDAMKKLNDGSSVGAAMDRLEKAYTSVETVLANQPKESDPTSTPVPPAPVAPVPPTPPVAPQPAPTPESPTPQPAGPTPEPAPQTSLPSTPAPETPQPADDEPSPIKTIPIAQQKPAEPEDAADEGSTLIKQPPRRAPVIPDDPVADARWSNAERQLEVNKSPAPQQPPAPAAPAPQKIAVPPVPTPKQTPVAPVPPIEPPQPVEATPATTPPKPAVSAAATGSVKSLADSAEPLKSINDLPTADSLATSASGDPLFIKEVTDGLNQLLADWSLFKKSGLFGTGPKGIEHPLYIKIKDLQIPLLLAGRFEGATQEIKQSVTDYMNGWRYEQGIIYEQGETFDHYLRRVIRHILDLQK